MATIDERLENWGAAWRSRGLYFDDKARGFAGVVESHQHEYRPAQPWDAPPISPPPAIDPHDAAIVERAVCALGILDHVLLKGWFVRRWSPGKCLGEARRASGQTRRSGGGSFEDAMLTAKAHLLMELDRPAVTLRARAVELARRALGMPSEFRLNISECVD